MRSGRLPVNNLGADPYNYEFTLPGEFTIDEGNDGKMYLSLLGRCCITRGIIANKSGLQEKRVRAANVASVDALMTEAEGLTKKHPWATEMESLNRLDNNGNVNQPVQQEPDALDESKVPSPKAKVPAAGK